MVRYGIATILLCMLLGTASPAMAGTVYKWTDQRGVVNYSTAPPPEAQRMVTVDTTPAVATAGGANDEDARAWREQRARELARDKREVEAMRQKREADQARQDQYRQQLTLAGQYASTEEERRRQAREQCLRERRVDCDSPASQVYNPYYPTQIIARPARQTIQQAAPFPVTGPTTGPAPGTIAGTQALLGQYRAATTTATRSASLRVAR
jgi:hypothetical protein